METFFKLLPFIPLVLFWSKNKLLQWSLMVVLIFIAGYRAITVGTDNLNYFLFFNNMQKELSFDGRFEPFYQLLNFFVVKAGWDYNTVCLFASILTIVPLYKAFNRNSAFPFFSWFVYIAFCYYFHSFNIVRQCMAASWLLLAYCYFDGDSGLFTRKNIKTILLTLVAVLFHYTAVLAFFVYAVYYIAVRYNKWYFIQIFSLLIGVFLSGTLFNIALRFLPFYDQFDMREDFIGSLVNLLILNVAFIVVNNVIKVKDKWFCLFFCYIIFSNLILQLPFANRPLMYAGIALTIFFPNFIHNNKLGSRYALLVWVLLVVYSLFRFSRLFGGGDILPYEHVL